MLDPQFTVIVLLYAFIGGAFIMWLMMKDGDPPEGDYTSYEYCQRWEEREGDDS